MHQQEFRIETDGRGTHDITGEVRGIVGESGFQLGLVHVFLLHTSASLMICENADPDVRRDLETFFARLVPDGDPMFVHRAEGPDDMSAHVRSVMTHTDLTVPVSGGNLVLGTWQGIYLWEHRTGHHQRRIVVTVRGD